MVADDQRARGSDLSPKHATVPKLLAHRAFETRHGAIGGVFTRIGGSRDGCNAGVADRVTLHPATGSNSRPAKALAVFTGGPHSIFTDSMGTGGAALNPKVKVATRQLALAFLKTLHAKDPLALEQWSGQHADIVARFEKAAF